jgi:hypothetical protein
LDLLGSGGAVPGGMADSDLAAREQRIADRRLYLGNAPLPAWGPFLLDRRPRTKTFAGFASGRLTLPLQSAVSAYDAEIAALAGLFDQAKNSVAVQKSTSFARQVRLLRSGPERIIFDIRNGVIPQLLRIDARALGGFDNPLGERGSNQRSHGRVSLIPQLGPSVIERLGDHLGLVGVEARL